MEATPSPVNETRTGCARPGMARVWECGSTAPPADVHTPWPGPTAGPSAGTVPYPRASRPSPAADAPSAISTWITRHARLGRRGPGIIGPPLLHDRAQFHDRGPC